MLPKKSCQNSYIISLYLDEITRYFSGIKKSIHKKLKYFIKSLLTNYLKIIKKRPFFTLLSTRTLR